MPRWSWLPHRLGLHNILLISSTWIALQQKIVSGGFVILVLLLLYRKIEAIGKISVIFGSIVILTIIWIIISGFRINSIK